MNIPDKIKIGFKDYEVQKVKGNVIDDKDICYGVIHYDDCFIEISTIYSDDTQKCALMHEVIHGIDDIFDIGLEEKQVQQLAKGLYEVIKDNPGIFKE
ncbi:MAG: hypothetical protein QME45_04315 [Clostridiales bacterium]|nr:hypothetical protein [Clostridiales bacterium]